jgi:hypothetical protein
VPKKVIIKIISYNTTTEELEMRDEEGNPAHVIKAWPGQKIKWIIKRSGVKSIDSIIAKTINKNKIFKEEPHKEIFSSNWKGIIKSEGAFKENDMVSDTGDYYYDYNIKWKLPKKEDIYTYDPRIQIQR